MKNLKKILQDFIYFNLFRLNLTQTHLYFASRLDGGSAFQQHLGNLLLPVGGRTTEGGPLLRVTNLDVCSDLDESEVRLDDLKVRREQLR